MTLKEEISKQIRTRDQFFFYACRLKDEGRILDFILGIRHSIIIHLNNERQTYAFY